MSAPVGSTELHEQVDRYGSVAYLVTVSPDTGRPHVVSMSVRWAGDALVGGAGTRTAANVGTGADVSLVWSPPGGGDYSLIVDGPAAILDGADGALVSVRPLRSVLHRLAGASAGGPGCIPVTTTTPTGTPTGTFTGTVAQEGAVEHEEHPNAAVVRRFLNAWFDGDFATWTSLAADDIVIHMRGKPALNGSYRGVEGVLAFFEKFAALNIEGFEMDVEDVVADDRFAVAIMRSAYTRGDEHLDLRNACAYKVDATGKITEVWNVSDAQVPESDFFSLVDAHPSGLGVGLGPP